MELLVGNGAAASSVPYTGGVTVAETETPAPAAEAPALSLPLAAAIAVALLAAALAACVTLLVTRRARKAPKAAAQLLAAPAVGKLHAQGARSSQQDSFYVSPEALYPDRGVLAVVADGMGGLADGDRVSQEAVRSIMNRSFELADTVPAEQRLLELLATANGAVNRLLGCEGIGRCGSTLLLGWLVGDKFHYLSVGDSRVWLMAKYVLPPQQAWPEGQAEYSVDGQSVGQGLFRPRGGEATLFFGADPRVSVTTTADSRKRGESGFIDKSKNWTWAWTYTLTNSHSKALTVRLERPAPMIVDQSVSVSYDDTPPSQKDEKKHMLFWEVKVPADGKASVHHSVTISSPTKLPLLPDAP